MKTAKMILDKDFTAGKIDPRIYGSFIEHFGRAVYGGIYEPGHPSSDTNGFRGDVLELVRALNIPVVRYPGGNFVSGFNWEDSIGSKGKRPRRLDIAWQATETNEVGIHEFCKWAKAAGTDVMYAVNLGTRGPDAARNLVEYANHPSGTYWSDLRRKNHASEPFNIKLWCLGNEMDGPWQICRKTPYEYARVAVETARVMKLVDPSIELVACGSSTSKMPSFGEWERIVLEECFDYVEYISMHQYYTDVENDIGSFLAQSMDMDMFIKSVISICDAVAGKKHSKRKINISFDEYNVCYHSEGQNKAYAKDMRWNHVIPLAQEAYTFRDSLLLGSMLLSLLRNAERVKIACLAQLVNSVAPIMTRDGGGAWRQTIYWPFFHMSSYGRGKVLHSIIDSPKYDCRLFDSVPYVDTAAVLNDNGGIVIFAVNRDTENDIRLECDLRAFDKIVPKDHIILASKDPEAINTESEPDKVYPFHSSDGVFEGGRWSFILPRLSWNVICL